MFAQTRMADVTVMCSKGLSEDNIRDIRNIEGVDKVHPGLYVDAMLLYGDKELNMRVRSLPVKETEENSGGLWAMRADYSIDTDAEAEMDILEIQSGRLPLDDTEVALDDLLLDDYDFKLGEWVEFAGESGARKLRVVGFVYSPKYVGIFERGNSGIGNGRSNGFAYASGNAVASLQNRMPAAALLKPVYTLAEIKVQTPEGISAFSGEYALHVNALIDQIEAYGRTQEGTWYVDDRSSNPGYDDYESNTERIGNVGKVFPVIFFVVAALVSLTTMTRMVEEQRVEMGTLKALGYDSAIIISKYFSYAMLACISGGLFGCVIGFWLLPTVILNAYGIMYRIPDIQTPFRGDIALIAILASAICTGVATFSACYAALKEVPSALMRPKAPKAGKRIMLERITLLWKRMSFTSKVTARNIFRYKKRFFMSIIGIAGSCSLLVTGFGLNDSIFGITEKQFDGINGIWQMDLQAYTYEALGYEDMKTLVESNPAYPDIESAVYCADTTCDAVRGNKRMGNVHVLGVENQRSLNGKINLLNNGTERYLREDGAIITTKLADTFGLSEGDRLDIIMDGSEYTVEISDIADNYIYHYIYMTKDYYKTVFGRTMEYNASLISLKEGISEEETDKTVQRLLSDQRMYTVRTLKKTMEDMENVLGVLNYIVLVLIVGSALLTLVVMVNLTNINLEERKRELATLRVLGFFDKEMYDYIFRENIMLTLIGAAMGLILGRYMHAFIIKTCEVDLVMFIRRANTLSYVYSFVLTAVFSLLVNLIMRRKVRSVDMVESLKSAE